MYWLVAYDDSQIGLEVDGKRWAGENYGFQSEESYNKLFVAGKLNPVQQGIDRVGNYISNSAKADPIVGPALEFLGNSASAISNVLPEPIKQGVGFVLDKNQEAAENIAAATGLPVSLTDPMTIADVATGGAVTATKPAVKTAVRETIQGASTIGRNLTPPKSKLALAGESLRQGGVVPDFAPSNVMAAVTINNPKVTQVTGRKVGDKIIANDPELAKHLTERRARIQRYENAIETAKENKLQEQLSDNPDASIIRRSKQELSRNRPKLYSAQSNVKPFSLEDPQQYGTKTKQTMAEKAAWYKERKAKGLKIQEKIHEHHLVTKGGSAAAFRKMEEFVAAGKADMDDLVLMYEYAAKKNAATGDRLSNNAFILDTPHNELHQQVLKPAGDEFTQKQWNKILKQTKTPEDLMTWWVDQVDNNYIPNKKTGLIWQDLDDLIKQIQSE